jgi:hypothetical protein
MAPKQPEYGYVAYIDEAGDPGLTKVAPRASGESSEWIVVSAALIPAELEGEVGAWVAAMMKAMNSHQMRDLHFQKLNAKPQGAILGLGAGPWSKTSISPAPPDEQHRVAAKL